MQFEIYSHLLFVIIGIIAGIINILAGSGSILTLGIMSLFGIPANVANGTNRIGIVLFGFFGAYQFNKKKVENFKPNFWFLILALIGSFFGTFTALQISNNGFEYLLGWIFLFLFFVVWLKPEEKFKNNTKTPNFLVYIFIFFIGFYAGFIQVGAGVILLILLKVLLKQNFASLNPLKLIVITLANVLALIMFTNGGLINWEIGISLAIGQIIGSYFGVKINQSTYNVNKIIQYSLMFLIALSVFKFWKLI